jgi:hypothetical protein
MNMNLFRVTAAISFLILSTGFGEINFIAAENGIVSFENGMLSVSDGSAVAADCIALPRTIRFEARMPDPAEGAPSYGIGQVWFSSDYGNEFDRIAFAVRGEKIQEVLMYDFQQRRPPSPELLAEKGQIAHEAFQRDFRMLRTLIQAGEWFTVELTERKDSVTLKINDEPAKTWPRAATPGRSFALGGSWQENRFRNISVVNTADSLAVPARPDAPRTSFLDEALKFTCGDAVEGWTAVNDAPAEEGAAAWLQPTSGTRTRTAPNVPAVLRSGTTLAHGITRSVLHLPVPPGDYLVSIACGDAEHGSTGILTTPDGKTIPAATARNEWKEIRFAATSENGAIDVLVDSDDGDNLGMLVCYAVCEPLSDAKLAGISFESDSDAESRPDLEAKRRTMRAGYQALNLNSTDSPAETFDLNGSWLFQPIYESTGGEETIEQSDSDWHVVSVPSFWNATSWWIYNCGHRSITQRNLTENIRHCDQQTFAWRDLKTAWYRQWIEVPSTWKSRRVFVEFDAVSTIAVVYCNGIEVGKHTGMFAPFEVEITDAIQPGQKNLIAVLVNSGIEDDQVLDESSSSAAAITMPITKERVTGFAHGMYNPVGGEGGQHTTHRQAGIWQGVRLRTSGTAHINNVFPVTALDSLELVIDADAQGPVDITTRVSKAGKVLIDQSRRFEPGKKIVFEHLAPEIWSPLSPNLYDLDVQLTAGGKTLDAHHSKIGFRTIEAKDGDLLLNGRRLHWLGGNMPPHGLKPNDRELAAEFFATMRKNNLFGVRSHASPFTRVWIEEADKAGILISQEGTWSWLNINETDIPQSISFWQDEWCDLIRATRAHPSIVMWTINNETHILRDPNLDQRAEKWDWLQDTIEKMRALDPTRPIVPWSGYVKKHVQNQLDEVADRVSGLDDGDIDDMHTYGGTYQGSWISRLPQYMQHIEDSITPGRPFVSQEAAKAYPNTDTGHQELSYQRKWFPQSWIGNDAYDHRRSDSLLEKMARMAKDQAAYIRRTEVDGWLLFNCGTWSHDSMYAGDMQPYPVWSAVKDSFEPVLIAMEMPERRFFAGARRDIELFMVNDSPDGSDLTNLMVYAELQDANGQTAARFETRFPDVPYFENRTKKMAFEFPAKVEHSREKMTLRLTAKCDGQTVAKNTYSIDVCSPSFVKADCAKKLFLNDTAQAGPFGKLMNQAGFDLAASTEAEALVYLRPDDSEWNKIIESAKKGQSVLVVSPQTLEALQPWTGKIELINDAPNGESVDIIEKTSPLWTDLSRMDLAWWAHPEKRVNTYDQCVQFLDEIPECVTPIVQHIPIHPYILTWRVGYQLLELEVEKGRVIVSTLNFDGVDLDPAAARFAVNVIENL